MSSFDEDCLEQWLQDDCTLTNKELHEMLLHHNEVDVSETTITVALAGMHYTVKKVTTRVEQAYSCKMIMHLSLCMYL